MKWTSNMYFRLISCILFFSFLLGVIILAKRKLAKNRHHPFRIHYSYKDVVEDLAQADKDTLVCFDVDDTLISSPDVFARMNYFPWWFKLRIGLRFLPHAIRNPSALEDVHSIIWHESPRELIEPAAVEAINGLKARGVTVLGLTALKTGGYGVVENFPIWRYEMLKKMGIEFSDTYPDHVFEGLPSHRGNFPTLYKGILCTNWQDKGVVLGAFFDHVGWTPKKVIFFDDKKKFLYQVGRLCRQRKIACDLFRYRAVEKLPGAWCTHRALRQIQYLLEEKRWVGDAFFEQPENQKHHHKIKMAKDDSKDPK